MLKILCTILGCFILEIAQLYIWYKLIDKKPNFKDFRLYITFFSLTIISLVNYYQTNTAVKIVTITIIFMIFFKFLFNETLQKCILTPIFYQLLGVISESIFAIIFALILGPKFEEFLSTGQGILITNVSIAAMNIFFVSRKATVKFYNWILKLTDKLKNIHLMPLSLILLIILNVADMIIYYSVDFTYLLLFNVLIIFICFSIFLYTLFTQNNYNKVSDKYNIAINSLNDYERMMTKYRVANHENKNLLLTVRAMILNKEKKIPEYIDSIIEDKYEDDEKLLFKMNVIPSGGLRGAVYSEILKIKENNIKYELNIDQNLKTVDLIELDTNTIIDICKIIGVFMDNAIEETKKIKDGKIGVSIYVENNKLAVKVSNNYSKKIDIDKIYLSGYTTKGNGHGFGLSLVKKLVDENKLFENTTELSKDLFSQVLKVSYKKTQI